MVSREELRSVRIPRLSRASDAELLGLRLGQLRLPLRGSRLERPLSRLRAELSARGFRFFAPHVWLSTEWFSPSGITGFAIPFCLAHPRLVALERAQVGSVEGEAEAECMRLLRHETGHALLHAYGLHRRKSWRETFGNASAPYRPSWRPDAAGRDHVLHLGGWYAQSHPVEDFCETFAVWVAPGERWKRSYACWPALKKLEWVDREMRRIAPLRPPIAARERIEELSTLAGSLAAHYRAMRRRYALADSALEDEALDLLVERARGERPVHRWLCERRPGLVRAARDSGADAYAANEVLGRWVQRSFERGLGCDAPSVSRARGLLADASRQLCAGNVPEFRR